jgi:hypothetical protein
LIGNAIQICQSVGQHGQGTQLVFPAKQTFQANKSFNPRQIGNIGFRNIEAIQILSWREQVIVVINTSRANIPNRVGEIGVGDVLGAGILREKAERRCQIQKEAGEGFHHFHF